MIVNRRDIDFLMYEMLDMDSILKSERYSDYDRETVTALIDSAQQIAEQKFLPSAAKLDANEPSFDGERVHIIPEVKEALDAYADAGLFAAGFDHDIGGLQLPWVVYQVISGMFTCANGPLIGYAFLTAANANMLNVCGSDELKSIYLQPMLEGRWYGTMCLSEPQAGSSLSDIRTRADQTSAGHYSITGTKMWISGGEQDISENIVHMVLARLPDAPPGVRGISLFLVPKYRVNADGNLGEKNNISLAGLNHKMGQRGTTNTLLNFGEQGECHGYLVGKENEGLANMFHMMNEARIGVGLGAVMYALGAYLYSLDYARNRPQGRKINNKDPETPQVNIIEHADVKRLLMAQKVYVEGGQALIMYCSKLVDQQKIHSDESEQQRLALLLEILTPIAKSWPSEYCLEANKHAIQVLGGYGYTREFPVERMYRDNRLNHIHEGTHAIHGIDILGRKVRMYDGAALQALMQEIDQTITSARQITSLKTYADDLTASVIELKSTTEAVIECTDKELALANATVYLDAMGHIVVAWLWLWQAIAAHEHSDEAIEADKAFYSGKLAACKFFYNYELPKVFSQLKLVAQLDDTCVVSKAEEFIGV
jgi:butyryl-CoA dehydrogenase